MNRFQHDPARLDHAPHLIPFRGVRPEVHASVFLADGSRIIGDVKIAADAGIWYNAVVRGDVHRVRIGRETNIQDNCVVHVTHEINPTIIGDRVTIGHGAIIHGCTLEDECLIGMGATILDRARVRSHSMVAAGALVPPGFEVPSGTLVAGVPARVLRELSEEEIADFPASARRYRDYARESMDALRREAGAGRGKAFNAGEDGTGEGPLLT